jgi:hypothetical protein
MIDLGDPVLADHAIELFLIQYIEQFERAMGLFGMADVGSDHLSGVSPGPEGFGLLGRFEPIRGKRPAWANGAIGQGRLVYRHGDCLAVYRLAPVSPTPGR